MAFHIGLFVVVKLLRPAWRQADGGLFWRVKRGRAVWPKLPMLALPRHSVLLVDRAALHPVVRDLARRPRWEHLWRVVVTALVLALALLVNATAQTNADGALPLHRRTMRVAGVVMLVVAAWTGVRRWF